MVNLLAALAVAAPIRLDVILPKSVTPGEVVEAAVKVTNVSKSPVTLIEAKLPNYRLGMSLVSILSGPKGQLDADYNSPMTGQWFSDHEIGPEWLFTLRPGESRELYRERFTNVFAGGRPSSGLLSDYAKAPREDLSPGEYRWRVVYRLTRQAEKPALRGDDESGRIYHPPPTGLTEKAKPLFARSWKGEIASERSFVVR